MLRAGRHNSNNMEGLKIVFEHSRVKVDIVLTILKVFISNKQSEYTIFWAKLKIFRGPEFMPGLQPHTFIVHISDKL